MNIYKVREVQINRIINGKVTKVQKVMIGVSYSKYPDILIPSKLTEYIFSEFSGDYSINTKLKNARAVVGFINYLNEQVELGQDNVFKNLKNDGLYGLKIIHLARYINYISSKSSVINSYNTVKEKEKMLIRFYAFLYKRNITSEDAKIEVKAISCNQSLYKNKRGRWVYINPLDDKSKYVIHYPPRSKVNKVLKDMDEDVWMQFIEYAEAYYPEIAFGVAAQFMGGLRQGEVINLTVQDIKVNKDKKEIMVHIQDRPELFEYRNINIKKSQTKKKTPREQLIYNFNDRLLEIYENHLNYISDKRGKKAIELDALFVNNRGEAMSGDSYESKFKNLKLDFIKKVKEYSASLAYELETHKWESHIGRHVYTNYLLKSNYINNLPKEAQAKFLQLARGDSSQASADVYIDNKSLCKDINKNINKLSRMAKEYGGNND